MTKSSSVSESSLVGKGPCPECSSSDAFASYDDGHGHCFSCGVTVQNAKAPQATSRKPKNVDFIDGEVRELPVRKITEETCRKFDYRIGEFKGKAVQVANYRDPDGHVVGQKVRFANKEFLAVGDLKLAGLYGQHLWRDGGKMVVVTEGEIDCLTVSQLQNNKWPVVSVPNGAQSAKKSLSQALDWLEKFDSVVLMFDDDEPGRKAVAECAPLFTPGKCKVARIDGFKDANAALQAGQGAKVIEAMWGAKVFRPDGIVAGTDTLAVILEPDDAAHAHYPWEDVDAFLLGLRLKELITITAGTGIGKSTVCREIAYSLMKSGENVGYIALEESVKRTVQGFCSIELNHPLHINREGLTDDQITDAWRATAGSGRLFLYDHWGSTDSDNLLQRVRYLARGCNCRWIVLDHLSIVVSGIGDGDERRLIDNTMTALRSLVEETGVGLLLVSHLKRIGDGKRGHEDGEQISLGHLRGSQAIAQLSDIVIGLERDQQSEDPNVATVRVLKNRHTGRTGVAGSLKYDNTTGRLLSAEPACPFPDAGGDPDSF
jgi:twinkle protein